MAEVVPVQGTDDIVAARQRGRALAAELGFTSSEQALIATAISELARNILLYAEHGEVELSVEERDGRRGLTVVARDRGPGIADIAVAMQDGYSTSGGLGLGLPGTKRLMDDFEVVSAPGAGTTVRATRWR